MTAMQLLLEQFKKEYNNGWFSFDEVEQNILDVGIPAEKQQIIDAWNNGDVRQGNNKHINNADAYYNNLKQPEAVRGNK
jgi:hypothetical protein